MIFAKNSKELIVVPKLSTTLGGNIPTPPKGGPYAIENESAYKFPKVEIITESQAYYYYRSTECLKKHIHRMNMLKRLEKSKTSAEVEFLMPLMDIYLIPKLYGYFPFLDCDTEDQFEECRIALEYDKIKYAAYHSSSNGYGLNGRWIFCDVEGTFEDTLAFIKKYPADGKYSWVAEHKNEFCVRAVPKFNHVPTQIQIDDSKFSRNFKFWIDDFNRYWTESELIQYIVFNVVTDNI